MDLSEDLVESFIENINIHCFKRRLIAEEFINIINKVSALSKNLGIPVEHLPDYIEQKKSEAGESERRNRRCRNKTTSRVLQHYNVTMDDLEEYKRNTPLIDYIKE